MWEPAHEGRNLLVDKVPDHLDKEDKADFWAPETLRSGHDPERGQLALLRPFPSIPNITIILLYLHEYH